MAVKFEHHAHPHIESRKRSGPAKVKDEHVGAQALHQQLEVGQAQPHVAGVGVAEHEGGRGRRRSASATCVFRKPRWLPVS